MGFPAFFLAKGPDCVADPFGNVLCRCFNKAKKEGKDKSGESPKKSVGSLKSRKVAKKTKWGSPKASHIKASHLHFPHFPRFRVRIFRIFRVFLAFARWNLHRPLFFWGERDFPHFPHFPRIGFESLISKNRPTGFVVTGLRWPEQKDKSARTSPNRETPPSDNPPFSDSWFWEQQCLRQRPSVRGASLWEAQPSEGFGALMCLVPEYRSSSKFTVIGVSGTAGWCGNPTVEPETGSDSGTVVSHRNGKRLKRNYDNYRNNFLSETFFSRGFSLWCCCRWCSPSLQEGMWRSFIVKLISF